MSSCVSKDCINHDSYGTICVGCNACGRFDKNTMWQARYDMYVRQLKELVSKYGDDYFNSNLQQENMASDVIYYGKKIKECVAHLEFGGTREIVLTDESEVQGE